MHCHNITILTHHIHITHKWWQWVVAYGWTEFTLVGLVWGLAATCHSFCICHVNWVYCLNDSDSIIKYLYHYYYYCYFYSPPYCAHVQHIECRHLIVQVVGAIEVTFLCQSESLWPVCGLCSPWFRLVNGSRWHSWWSKQSMRWGQKVNLFSQWKPCPRSSTHGRSDHLQAVSLLATWWWWHL